MKRRHNPCLILVALLLLTSALPLTQGAVQVRPEARTELPLEFNDFDDAISNLTERWSIPGAQVAVMFNGTPRS